MEAGHLGRHGVPAPDLVTVEKEEDKELALIHPQLASEECVWGIMMTWDSAITTLARVNPNIYLTCEVN